MRSRKGGTPPATVPEPPPAGSRFQFLILAILLAVITLGVFQAIRSYEFLSWDDKFNILTNANMNKPGGPDYGYYWNHAFLYTYRPLIYEAWSFIADHARLAAPQTAPGIGDYQFDPHVFHTVNWLLHPVNVVLVFVILRMLVKKDWAAFAGALLVGIHPLQDESVVWITGGNELLYGFFALMALWRYLCYAAGAGAASDSTRSPARGDRAAKRAVPGGSGDSGATARSLNYAAACLFFVLALAAKPTAVCLPLIAAALDIWAVRRPAGKVILALTPWLAVAFAWVFVTAWARQLDTTVAHTALWVRPFVAGDAIAFYLYKLILPFNLAIEYGRSPAYVMAHPWVYVTFLVPIAITALLWKYRSVCPLLVAAFAVFIAALLPTIGLVPNNYQFYSTVADHYMYLALLGPAIALAWLLSRVQLGRISGQITTAVCALFLVFCGVLASTHARDYRNDETLYLHTVAANPISWVSHYNYGRYLADQGKLEDAAKHLRAAVALKPDLADGYNNLGVTLAALGHDDEALEMLKKAIALEPQNAFYWVSIGPQYEKMGRNSDAIAAFTSALQFEPNNPDSEFHLGMDLSAAGQLPDAQTHLARSLELAPGNAMAENNLAIVMARQGRVADALPHWQAALQAQPDYASAHYNYGAALENLRRIPEAIAEYQTALRLSPQSMPARAALARLAPQGKR